MPVSVSNKDRLKKSVFKVKDPEKFEKQIKLFDREGVESLDFTGLEMGN